MVADAPRPGEVTEAQDGRCRSCRAPLPAPILRLGPQPLDDRLLGPLDAEPALASLALTVCPACSLIQLAGDRAPRPTGLVHGDGAAFSSTIAAHGAGWADELVGDRQPPDLRVLDVGDGRGPVFARLAARGATVVAGSRPPDVLDQAAAVALAEQHGAFDLIVSDHALAHADDLDAVIEAMAGALARDGRVAIEAHHALGLAGGQFDIVSHAHRTYLSLVALEAALGRHGLVVTEARVLDLHGGSLRVVAQRSGGGTAPSAASGADEPAAVLALERSAGLDDGSGLRGLDATAAAVAADLREFLTEARGRGWRVGGYGAAARGATLLAYAAIGPADLPYIADLDPAKAGRRLPGSGIPVRPAAELDAEPPDRLLVLPWPLLDEIAGQLDHLRASGTRFVAAMPRLRVVG